MQTVLRPSIDITSEQIFQFDDQAAWKPWGHVWTDIDEKVEVAVRSGRTSCHRSEDTDVRRAVFGCDPEDLIASF